MTSVLSRDRETHERWGDCLVKMEAETESGSHKSRDTCSHQVLETPRKDSPL